MVNSRARGLVIGTLILLGLMFISFAQIEVDPFTLTNHKTWSVKNSRGQDLGASSKIITDLDVKKSGNIIYDAEITFQKESPIGSIWVKDLNISRPELRLSIDEVQPGPTEKMAFKKIYAIDPSQLDFRVAQVKATAQGSYLYKCKDWDSANQSCPPVKRICDEGSRENRSCTLSGGWEKIMKLTPGTGYSFTLTPQDPGFAEYSAAFTAPYCADGASPCEANSTLLKSVDNAGGTSEPNEPNTIDICTDGTFGTYMTDESVENITVTDFNNSFFRPNDTVGVEAWVNCYGVVDDHLGLAYTNNSNAATPQWTLKQFMEDGCPGTGFQRIVFNNFTLDNVVGNHSVRVYITYDTAATPPQNTCAFRSSGNRYDDNDDLVFNVLDLSGPHISNPAFNESIIDPSEIVRFNVSVSDPSSVDSVIVTFRYPNGTLTNRSLSRYVPQVGIPNQGFDLNDWTGWNWTFNRYAPGGGGGEDCNDNTYWGRKMLLTSPDNDSYFEPSGDWERGSPSPVGGGGSNEATLTTGGDDLYHGQIISDPFIVPPYSRDLSFWGHAHYLSAEDSQCDAGTRHSGTLNATSNLLNEYVGFFLWVDENSDTVGNTNIGDDYLIWETYSNAIQGLGSNQNLDIDPTNFSVPISDYIGKTVYVTGEIVGTGGADDALIQIDSLNFTSDLYITDWTDTLLGGTYNATLIWADDSLGNINSTIITNTSFFVNASNFPPGDPSNIQCDGADNCNITVDSSVLLNASGSTDPDGDNITYSLEALLLNITKTGDLETGTIQLTGMPSMVNRSVGLMFEDFEGSGWTTIAGEDPVTGCSGGFGTNFTNCLDNGDYEFARSTGPSPAGGSYSWVADDWDNWDSSSGIWFNFNPQTACNGTTCNEVIVSGYGAAGSLDNANEYCRVWTRNDTTSSYADIWYCTDGDACEFSNGGSAMPSAPGDWTYFEANFTQGQSLGASTNASVHIGGRVPGPGDQCFFDEINITGVYETVLPSADLNTRYTLYNNIDGDYNILNEIEIMIEVDSFNPSASNQQSTAYPDLELDLWNGSEWINLDVFNLSSFYIGSGLNTTNHNFTLTTNNTSILSSWTVSANQDLRIRGINMDYFNSTIEDEINYTGLWATLRGSKWLEIGNHSESTALTWNTTSVPEQTCVDLRSRSIDPAGSGLYSDYYVKNSCMNISHSCSVAIGLSFGSIDWDVQSLPAVNQGATGNNGAGTTDYNISIVSSGCTADLYIKADGDLQSGLDTIGLGNETYRYNTTDDTVPGASYTPLDTDYPGNQIGSNLGDGSNMFLKYFLSVPGGQAAGNYNNTILIKGVKAGTPP